MILEYSPYTNPGYFENAWNGLYVASWVAGVYKHQLLRPDIGTEMVVNDINTDSEIDEYDLKIKRR